MPTTAKLANCQPRPGASRAWRTLGGTGSRVAPDSERRATRAIPFRSSSTVRTMSTRLSGSSTQSTGTSWIRRPDRSASSSSSVSKNQALSSTSASSRCTTSVLAALKPHCASENFAAMVARSSTL